MPTANEKLYFAQAQELYSNSLRTRPQPLLSRSNTSRFTQALSNILSMPHKTPYPRPPLTLFHLAAAATLIAPSHSVTLHHHVHNASIHLPTPTTPPKYLKPSLGFNTTTSICTYSRPQQSSACCFLRCITASTATDAELKIRFIH